MEKMNSVFIATSLDGFIADTNGGIDWLDTFPEINTVDSGYAEFTSTIDALVMGRGTFEKVCSFDIDWPYQKPVFVASRTLERIPETYVGKAFLLKGTPHEMLEEIHRKGHHRLYIDGGKIIQSFLKEDLIDQMIITVIPVLLGSGIPLFGALPQMLRFQCVKSVRYVDAIVQNHFVRKR